MYDPTGHMLFHFCLSTDSNLNILRVQQLKHESADMAKKIEILEASQRFMT